MPEHTEREREARELQVARVGLLDAMAQTPRNSDAVGAIGKAVDRLETAVRSAVLAEVLEVVETHRLDSPYDLSGLRAALAALEATDGR